MSTKSPPVNSGISTILTANAVYPDKTTDTNLLALPATGLLVNQKLFTHIPFLDGLRAISIFAVLTFHSRGPIGALLLKNGGWIGVDAFFVISGFLISGILLKEQDKTTTIRIKNFYIRRALRLLPVFLLWILFTSTIRILNHKFSLAAAAVTAVYMSDYGLACNIGNVLGSGFELAWSLSVEEKFYLIWPSIVKIFRTRLLQIGLIAIVADLGWKAYLIYQGASVLRICSAFDTKVDSLMIGCVAAIMINDPKVKKWLENCLRSNLISWGLLVLIALYTRGMGHPAGATTLAQKLLYWDLRLPVFALSVAALLITLSVRPNDSSARILGFAPIAFIGQISYSLYLWHIAAFSFALWLGWQIHPMVPIEMEIAQYTWAVVFATCSYYLIEKPFLKIKNRFTTTLPPASTVKDLVLSKART